MYYNNIQYVSTRNIIWSLRSRFRHIYITTIVPIIIEYETWWVNVILKWINRVVFKKNKTKNANRITHLLLALSLFPPRIHYRTLYHYLYRYIIYKYIIYPSLVLSFHFFFFWHFIIYIQYTTILTGTELQLYIIHLCKYACVPIPTMHV